MFVFLCVGRPQCREDKCHLWDQNAPDVTPPKVNKPHNLDKQSCDIEKIAGILRGWDNSFEKALSFDEYGRPSGQQSMILGLMNEFNKSRNQIHLSRSNLGQFWKMFVEQKNVFTEPIFHQNQPSSFSAFIIVREMASSQLITQTNYTSPSIYKDYKTYCAWLWIIIFQDSTKKFQKWHPKQCSAKCELFTDVFLPTISEKTYLKICVLKYHSQKNCTQPIFVRLFWNYVIERRLQYVDSTFY